MILAATSFREQSATSDIQYVSIDVLELFLAKFAVSLGGYFRQDTQSYQGQARLAVTVALYSLLLGPNEVL